MRGARMRGASALSRARATTDDRRQRERLPAAGNAPGTKLRPEERPPATGAATPLLLSTHVRRADEKRAPCQMKKQLSSIKSSFTTWKMTFEFILSTFEFILYAVTSDDFGYVSTGLK